MAALQAFMSSSCTVSLSSHRCGRGATRATLINVPKVLPTSHLSLPTLPAARGLVEELEMRGGTYDTTTATATTTTHAINIKSPTRTIDTDAADPTVTAKLHVIMEAVADRVEMHNNMGEQRNNWNSLLLTSINAITLSAATMAGIAATNTGADSAAAPFEALKLSSTFMYLAATGMLLIMNKIQPSQLAEEQRNAARLFKQLHTQIQTIMSIGNTNTPPTIGDVRQLMERVLALDKAYPLPLIGVMLEKFPSKVEPAVWWPRHGRVQQQPTKGFGGKMDGNGWSGELEEEMRGVVGVVRRRDKADYLRLGEKALKLNKALAISGPLLTGLAAIGTAFVGSHGSWAAVLGIVGGALASVVNTLEHGGQVGMVFEMYRGNAGFFELMEESIESNLKERDVERRENGELFQMKVALQLGRSLSELKELAASSSSTNTEATDHEEFASKLF